MNETPADRVRIRLVDRDGNGMTKKEREALLAKGRPERAFEPRDWRRTTLLWPYRVTGYVETDQVSA